MKALLAALAMFGATAAAPPSPKVYAVIFEVSHNERGQLIDFKMSRVIDPASGKTDPLKVDVPQVFVDGARGRSLSPLNAGKTDHYFTYYILNPDRPTDLFIEKF